jgi:DNA-binding NtrC family response regulator
MSRLALIVDPHPNFSSHLAAAAVAAGWQVFVAQTFEEARAHIAHPELGLLATSLKLGSFNGIHLVYLARQANPGVVCLVHGDTDFGLAGEAQQAGAFFERRNFAPVAFGQYLSTAALPARDRRDARYVDRRTTFRGGRRKTDIPMLHALTVESGAAPRVEA